MQTAVTAGLPGLTPRRRNERDTVERTRFLSNRVVREQVARDAFTVAPDGNQDTTNFLSQLGHPLSSSEVIVRLKKMNSNLHFELSRGDSSKYGVYVIQNRTNPETGNCETHKRFICGMEAAYMPEFSVRHAENDIIPDPNSKPGELVPMKVRKFKSETRGWRTVLATLIRNKLITQFQADRYFPSGRSSLNWQTLTGQKEIIYGGRT